MGRGTRCWRCQLHELVVNLLIGPDGVIADRLQPLADAIITMPRPNSGYAWLRCNARARELLEGLADGRVGLTHEALDELPNSQTVEYLRGLLVGHGCLPPRDPHLAGFERWLATKLPRIEDLGQRQIIDRFAHWHLLRQLRSRAADGAVPAGAFLNAKQSTTVAIQFLVWLGDRGCTLDATTQHELDVWFGSGPSTRRQVLRFLYWARDQRLLSNVKIPIPSTGNGPAIGQEERLAHLRRVLLDDQMQPAHRLIAVLVLVFGQPLSKIVRLTLDDVTVHDDGQVTLRLGGDALELPARVAVLVTVFLADPRYRRNTAANRDARWLFPGLKPGQPLHWQSARRMLREAGIPPLAARTGTWLQLVREAPPAILAAALGINVNTVTRYATLAGTDYQKYVAPLQPRC